MPIEITMPALSPTMTEGNLAKWTKKEGDKIKAGEVIAEIETDKATMEVEAVDEGVLGRIVVKAGTEGVKVNEVIALLLADGEDKKALDSWKPKAAPQAASPEPTAKSLEPTMTQPVATAVPSVAPLATKAPAAPLAPAVSYQLSAVASRVKASPLAKRLAVTKGVDLTGVIGSGPGGRIVKADIEAGAGRAGGGAVRRNPVEFVQVPNNSMRKVIARRLTESKQTIPHFYVSVDVTLDHLLELRERLNAQAPKNKEGVHLWKISVNDFIIKAMAMALIKVPDANVSWTETAMVKHKHADIGIAVSIPGGLITPVIRKAETKGLAQISTEMKDYAKRARDRKLKPEEYTGGSAAISNMGMMNVSNFAAIVNPPHASILAIGTGTRRPVVRGNDIVIEQQMTMTLSTDHRCIDGALGAEFINAIKLYLEEPGLMLV